MKPQVIGWCDTKWKPPRKSKLELEIEREDLLYWSRKEVEPLEYRYKASAFHLTDTAKEAFSKGIYYVKLLRL